MDKPLLDAVAEVLRERFAAIDEAIVRATAAVRITRIENAGPGVALVVFGDGSTQSLTLPPGERGADGIQGAPGNDGAPGVQGPPGTGERGAPGPEGIGVEGVELVEGGEAFALRFTNGETVEVPLPRGLQGERGEPGAPGEPGRDRFVCAPRAMRDGERVEKNELIAWGGGIVQALRATSRTPDDEPASFACIVAGISSVGIVENLEARAFELTVRLTNGIEQVCRMRSLPRLLGDGPRPGERVLRGDQIVKGDWLYTATQDGAEAGALDSGGWRRQYLRGKKGDPGERGSQGAPGVGIVDVSLDAGILTVTLSTGEERHLDAAALVQGLAA